MNNFITPGSWEFPKDPPPSMTLGDAISRYDQEVISTKGDVVKTKTRHTIAMFLRFMEDKELDAKNYREWVHGMVNLMHTWIDEMVAKGWAWWTIWLHVRYINEFFSWCFKFGLIAQNPMKLIDRRRNKGRRTIKEPVTEAEYRQLLDYAAKHPQRFSTYGPYVTAWHTGFSVVDVALLRWDEIDRKKMVISKVRKKTKTLATVPIIRGSEFDTLLHGIRSEQDPREQYVFPDLAYENNVKGLHNMRYALSRIMHRAGLPKHKTFHSLRYAFASRVAASGVNLAIAGQLTGHKNLGVLKKYIKPDITTLHQAMQQAFPSGNEAPTNVIQLSDQDALERIDSEVSPTQPASPEKTQI